MLDKLIYCVVIFVAMDCTDILDIHILSAGEITRIDQGLLRLSISM